jgi:hypothetical protein
VRVGLQPRSHGFCVFGMARGMPLAWLVGALGPKGLPGGLEPLFGALAGLQGLQFAPQGLCLPALHPLRSRPCTGCHGVKVSGPGI